MRSEAASEGLQEAVKVHDEALDERIVGLVVGKLGKNLNNGVIFN